jgi:hypothetical protein
MLVMMKRVLCLIAALILFSCNSPVSMDSPNPTLISMTEITPPSTAITTRISSTVPPTLVPPSLTSTPVPCDPFAAEYCITDGHFLFHRPILPPSNDTTDITYLYASTQNGKRDPHHGVEFQNAFGTPVHAAGDGVVIFAEADKTIKFSPWANFYGNVIVIRHTGELYTLYAHLSEIFVQAGEEVNAGYQIGKVGATGGATGSHLHFEVRKGSDYTDHFSTENPELWMIPPQGMGAISITLLTDETRNYERPLVLTRYADGSDIPIFTYYLTTYTKGFEHHAEDSVLSNLPPGKYKVAFTYITGLQERFVYVEAGNLTELIFDLRSK